MGAEVTLRSLAWLTPRPDPQPNLKLLPIWLFHSWWLLMTLALLIPGFCPHRASSVTCPHPDPTQP